MTQTKRFSRLGPNGFDAAPRGLELPLMVVGLVAACHACSVSGHENPNWGRAELARGVMDEGALWTAEDAWIDGARGARLQRRRDGGPPDRDLFFPYDQRLTLTIRPTPEPTPTD